MKSIHDVSKELEELWVGSGYSIKSIIRYLRDDLQLAYDTSVASETGQPYTFFGSLKEGHFVFNIDMSDYEILVPWRNVQDAKSCHKHLNPQWYRRICSTYALLVKR